MAVTPSTAERITIDDDTVSDVRRMPVPDGASLVLRTADGSETPLPANVQRMLLGALSTVATHGSATIGSVPEQLTSTVAAELLGVSRPTLLKLAQEGTVRSFKVGTHTRFMRDEILRVRDERAAARRAALDDLRTFDAEHAQHLDD